MAYKLKKVKPKEKIFIGLDRYLVTFKTNEDKNKFAEQNKSRYNIEEVFINNGYALELKKRRIIM